MAFIEDLVTEEELTELENAGADFCEEPRALTFIENPEYDYYVEIQVDKRLPEILEALS